MNRMDDALTIHRERTHRFAGESCLYRRNRFEWQVECVAGSNTTQEAEDELGGRADIHVSDFLIRISDLVRGGLALEPQRGDQIVYRGKVYDVVPGVSGVAWRFSDNRRTWYRVHTDYRADVPSE